MTAVDTFLAGQSPGSKVLYRVVRSLIVLFCRIFFRLTIYGQENIPKTGAFILAPIHRSNVDTPITSAATTRRLRFMGKDSLWRNKPVAVVLSALGGFPVTRGVADLEALKRCLIVLAAGEPLVLFPEGTRQSGATVQPLFDGAAYLAIKASVPIVPVGFGGTEAAMPKGSKMIYPRKCSMVIGAPIFPPQSQNSRLPRTATTDLTADLARALQIVFDDAKSKIL